MKTGRISQAIAGEVVKGPYESALANVQAARLQAQITVRLANGLAAFDPALDGVTTITIAGMGGHLIAEILEDGRDKLCQVSTLILQPNNGERHLRTWLQAHDFTISDEKILAENDKIYEIIVAHPGQSADTLTEAELCFGPFLLQEKSAVFLEKWASELAANQAIMARIPDSAQQKQAEFSAKIAKIQEVLDVSQ